MTPDRPWYARLHTSSELQSPINNHNHNSHIIITIVRPTIAMRWSDGAQYSGHVTIIGVRNSEVSPIYSSIGTWFVICMNKILEWRNWWWLCATALVCCDWCRHPRVGVVVHSCPWRIILPMTCAEFIIVILTNYYVMRGDCIVCEFLLSVLDDD